LAASQEAFSDLFIKKPELLAVYFYKPALGFKNNITYKRCQMDFEVMIKVEVVKSY
jgi:hypothetical protein